MGNARRTSRDAARYLVSPSLLRGRSRTRGADCQLPEGPPPSGRPVASYMEVPLQFYLGEYPWHPDIIGLERQEWSLPPGSPLDPVYPTVATYTKEKSGYDHSIDRTIQVELPAPWLADQMVLRMKGGHSPVFVDSDGRTMFMDPSVLEPGPSAALVDRDAFLLALEQREFAAIWVIAGEKSAYGGPNGAMGFGGRLTHTAIYRLRGDGFSRSYHQESNDPAQEQLETISTGQGAAWADDQDPLLIVRRCAAMSAWYRARQRIMAVRRLRPRR